MTWTQDEILTTGTASRLLGVSRHKLIDLCKAGILRSWKVPNSRHRRIMMADLLDLARRFGIPIQGGRDG